MDNKTAQVGAAAKGGSNPSGNRPRTPKKAFKQNEKHKKDFNQKKSEARDPLAGDLSWLFHGKTPWRRILLELRPKSKTISLRMNEDRLAAMQKKAYQQGIAIRSSSELR